MQKFTLDEFSDNSLIDELLGDTKSIVASFEEDILITSGKTHIKVKVKNEEFPIVKAMIINKVLYYGSYEIEYISDKEIVFILNNGTV